MVLIGCKQETASEQISDDPAILANTLENSETPPDLPDDTPPGAPETTEELQTTLAAPLIDPGALEPEIKAKRSLIKTIGMAFGEGLTAFVYPEVVTTGNNLLISVIPASEGIYKNVYIYKSPNFYKKYVSLQCNTYKCTNPVNTSFTIPASWASGGYYASIYDYGETNYQNRWKKFYFNVTGGAAQRDLYVEIYPKTLNVGEDLQEIIIPGTDGVYNRAYYYTTDNKYKTNTVLCTTSPCHDTINTSFTIPASWASGGYYLRIYDYGEADYRNRWKKFYFNVTGGAAQRDLHLQTYPETVNAGDDLGAVIIPGTDGVYNRAYFYTTDNKYKTNTVLCATSKCYDAINTSFTIPASWASGGYYLRIYDYGEADYQKRWKKAYFNVTGGTPPRDLYVKIYPETINVGEDLQEVIIPGTDGVYNRAYYYTTDNKYKTNTILCATSKCYDAINTSFTIPKSWTSGKYYLRIYDYMETDYRNRWKKFNFEVTQPCTNSDGGKDYYVKGTVKGRNIAGSYVEWEDSCGKDDAWVTNPNYLMEMSCDDGIVNGDNYLSRPTVYQCPNGCQDGACIPELENYPDYFIQDGKFKGVLVVGDKAPAEDVISISDIAMSLQYSSGASQENATVITKIEVGATKLASEVSDPYAQNIIAVGRPCVNAIVSKFLDNTTDCYYGLSEGYGTIKLMNLQSKIQLMVFGHDNTDTRTTSAVIANYKDYNLKGTEQCVHKVNNKPVVGSCDSKKCTDSDGGKDYYVKGTVSYSSGSMTDICSGYNNQSVEEYYCDDDPDYFYKVYTYNCPNSCKDGACISGVNVTTCTDSDGGNDISEKGTTTGKRSINDNTIITRVDLCTWFPNGGPTNHLTKCSGADCGIYEYYCGESGEVAGQLHNCSNSCNDGTCTI